MAFSVEERRKTGVGLMNAASNLLEEMKILKEFQDQSEAKKSINSELWHACAGPLVSLPQVGSLVYYFPQGHIEQVAFSTKRAATSHIPNYPNLPSQLMCQVHNVTLHADRETDEIYAQMTLQPVNTEKDVFRIPGFGPKPSKHPSEYFCKTLTASDTSTHGGFSVPRRAAEKLFPPLDYAMQPPSQELVVRDLHDNLWTFRHIYRGQPKRHLLTTGWSLFVGAKRLRAGDAVLFIRDEKSQLLLGVRRANRQQTALSSSVLSAESMHIGVLAAAAHAVANRSPFTIFYNPRACPSEFVIPLPKYQRAVYGTQVSIGMRFGMMFETEESSKRRYMGTIVATSDLDPLRWPGSKWRNLQVEWDEPGCDDQQIRVNLWEIETPESLFIFPSFTSNLKRSLNPGIVGAEADWGTLIKRPFVPDQENGNGDLPYPPIPSLDSGQLIKMLLKPSVSHLGAVSSAQPACVIRGNPLQEVATLTQASTQQNSQFLPLQNNVIQCQKPPQNIFDQPLTMDSSLVSLAPLSEKVQPMENQSPTKKLVERTEIAPVVVSNQLTSLGKCSEDKVGVRLNPPNLLNQLLFQDHVPLQVQLDPRFVQQQLDPNIVHSHQIGMPQLETSDTNGLFPYPSNLPSLISDTEDWSLHHSNCQPLAGILRSPGPLSGYGKQNTSIAYSEMVNPIPSLSEEIWDPQSELAQWPQHDPINLQGFPNSCGLRDPSDESNDQSDIYNGLHFEVSNGGSTIFTPPVSSAVLDGFSTLGDVGLQTSSNCLVGNIMLSQDVQSQITTASINDSQGFSVKEFQDNSGGTSLSTVDFGESSLLQKGSWQQVPPPLRTYTKVQKLGSVGRSVDVTRFKNYEDLRSAIACMFGIEGLLDDPKGLGWKLVYTDCENDVLLVGDDMWEEFVSSVRCIRILSPIEFQQMSEDGIQLLNNNVM